jgi:hypothetical protein
MTWVRIDDNAPHHAKLLKAGSQASWLWVCGLAYCQRMKTDGVIPTEALPVLGAPEWAETAPVLCQVGLWIPIDGGYQVHDYLDYNGSAEERDAKAEANRHRVQKFREKQRQLSTSGNASSNALLTRSVQDHVMLLPSPPLHSSTYPPVPPLVRGGARPQKKRGIENAVGVDQQHKTQRLNELLSRGLPRADALRQAGF